MAPKSTPTPPRNGYVLAMTLRQKKQVMRDRRARRPKDKRNDWRRDEP
jgi:hypothetical protein